MNLGAAAGGFAWVDEWGDSDLPALGGDGPIIPLKESVLPDRLGDVGGSLGGYD
jgi:hypothetical protein